MNATYIFIVSSIVTIIISIKIRSLKTKGKDKQAGYHFLTSSLEFLVPFSFVMLLYAVLISVVTNYWESISLQSLINIEKKLETIKSYTSWKLSNETVFALFLGIYTLGLLRVISLNIRKKIYSGIDSAYKWSKRLYVFVVLLCSFTILGTQLGEPSKDLNLKINRIREGFADIYKETQRVIAEEAAFQLYNKSQNAFPDGYQSALTLPEKISSATSELSSQYLIAQKDYGIKSNKTESVLKSIEMQRKSVSSLNKTIKIPGDLDFSNIKIPHNDSNRFNYQKIVKAKKAIDSYRNKTRSRSITILTTEDGKRLAIQGAKVMTSILKSELFSQWIKAYPIVEPVIDVFANTIDETVKSKINKTADSSTVSIINNPDKIQNIINAEASTIADKTKIVISTATMEKANQYEAQMSQKLANILEANKAIKESIIKAENREIDKLIAQLEDTNRTTRMNAAKRLSQKGLNLSQEKIDRLLRIMRTGNKEWETSSYRPAGLHCTDYEYTSIKHYAAAAVEDMNSTYITRNVAREARTIKRNSVRTKRVTDPGWV